MPIVWNTDQNEHQAALLAMFANATRFECAVAFVKWSGFDLIQQHLVHRLQHRMEARIIAGLSFYQTDPRVLAALLRLKNQYANLSVYVSPIDEAVCFHPKMYAFRYQNGGSSVLIGSANMTAGGFGDNWECSLKIGPNGNGVNGLANSVFNILDQLVDDDYVQELDQGILGQYSEAYRRARALVPVFNRKRRRILAGNADNLDLLREIVAELRADRGEDGFQQMSKVRRASIERARIFMTDIIKANPQTQDSLRPMLKQLRGCFHSGMLDLHVPEISQHPGQFINFLQAAHENYTEEQDNAYTVLSAIATNIPRLGPNWVSEALHALDDRRFAVLNKNSTHGMAIAQRNDFPERPGKANIDGRTYGRFCREACQIVRELDLENLSQLDLVFNYAYFNRASG